MLTVFLSYARADGSQAATRLRAELEAMGFEVWRDVEDMQGGLAWKEQLREALRQVDAVLVLLTPESTASKTVEWEWETALTLGKRVIGLLIAPCDVPPELARLHYHDLSDPASYTLGLAKLARDLLPLAAARPTAPPPPPASGSKYHVGTAINSSIGDDPVAINQYGSGAPDPAAIARLVAALRAQAPNDPAVQAEIVAMLREMKPELAGVAAGVRELQAGQAALLARYDQGEQHVIGAIIARLDAQETTMTGAILDKIETGSVPSDELKQHLTDIEAALAEVSLLAEQIQDRQLTEGCRQVAQLADDPALDTKHKLKITIPIIPVLLAYEGEVELSSRINLAQVWQSFREWA